jgi:hypothetical protein
MNRFWIARIPVAVLLSSGSAAAFGPAVRTQADPPRPSELPLVITAVRIDTGDPIPAGYGMPKLDVRNDGKLKIIACGVSFDVILPDGTTESQGLTIDSAHTIPALRTSEIPPGGVATIPDGGGGGLVSPQATGGAAHATFVVFDDDTALGDEREIARIFERRRQHQTFWHEMEAIFAEVTAHETDPTAAFVLIGARMESERDPTFKTGGGPWYDEMRARMTEHRMTLVQTTPERVLENLRTTIAEQKALSDTHLQRRR